MRLTPIGKALIAAMVLAALGYVVWRNLGGAGLLASNPSPTSTPGPTATPAEPRNPRRIVVGVNDFGGAYPGLVANDGATAGPGSRFTAAGLEVEIRLIRGSKERLEAFDKGEVDVMLLTLDYFANLAPTYRDKGAPLKAFLMVDWSRGNLGIVARPDIRSIEGLRDARVATTRNTPTHYLLLSLLKKSNLTPAEIEKVKTNLVFATKTPQAGELFKRGEVEAVAIWEPHLSQAMAGDKGRLLVSTATATNLVADVLFAREDFVKRHEADLVALSRAWLEGVAALNKDPDAGVKVIARAFSQPEEEVRAVLGKIKPATFADNRVFLGLDRESCPYVSLFNEASRFWLKEGVIKEPADARGTRWLGPLEALQRVYADEKIAERFEFKAGPRAGVDPLLTKSVSIYFASGDALLGPNAKQIVDQFAETLEQLGNTYVRVEGNTDNQGGRAGNVALSKKRAAAVVRYLTERHGLDPSRLLSVGNGPDKPVGDNKTEAGREQNRRTDFAIIPNL